MDIEKALAKIASLEKDLAKVESERDTLVTHKESLEKQLQTAKDKRDAAISEAEALKEKLPSEDSRVLTRDEAKTYEAYLALGDVTLLTAKVNGHDDAVKKAKTLERESRIGKAAADKWNAQALQTHLPVEADLEEYDTTKDGNAVKAWRIKQVIDGKAETIPLEKWIETTTQEKFVDFLLPTTVEPTKRVIPQVNSRSVVERKPNTEVQKEQLQQTGNYNF